MQLQPPLMASQWEATAQYSRIRRHRRPQLQQPRPESKRQPETKGFFWSGESRVPVSCEFARRNRWALRSANPGHQVDAGALLSAHIGSGSWHKCEAALRSQRFSPDQAHCRSRRRARSVSLRNSFVLSFLLEQSGELPPRPGAPRHHRTNRHARYVGDLLVGTSIKFSENNYGFEFQRYRLKRLPDSQFR